MNPLKDSLICQICFLIYDKPVKLPCSKSICKSHLYHSNGTLNSNFECNFCALNHPIPPKGFRPNFNIQHQIDAQRHLTEDEFNIKQNSEKSIKSLETVCNQTYERTYDCITERYTNIKRDIDLHKNQLKLKIDEIAEKLLNKVNHHELMCKLELAKSKTICFEKYMLELELCFRRSQVEIEEIKRIENKLKKIVASYEANVAQLIESKLEWYVFEPAIIDDDCKLFGKLIHNFKLVIAKRDGTLWLQDLRETSSNSVMLSDEHSGSIRCMSRSLDQRKLLVGHSNGTIRVWDTKNWKIINSIKSLKNAEETIEQTLNTGQSVTCLTRTAQPDTIISGSINKKICLWNIKTGKLKKFYKGHTKSLKCLEVLSERFFASGSNDSTIRIWHFQTNKCVRTLMGHTNSVFCLKKLNEFQFASGSQDQSIKIWGSFENSIECVRTLYVNWGTITRLEVVESLNFLVSSSMVIHVWNMNTYQCVWRLIPNQSSTVKCLRILPNKRIITGQKNKTLELFCLNTGKSLRVIKDVDVYLIEAISVF